MGSDGNLLIPTSQDTYHSTKHIQRLLYTPGIPYAMG